MATTTAFEAYLFVPNYWCPAQVIAGFGIGLEDLLFMFVMGSLCVIAATWSAGDRIEWRLDWRRLARRYPICLGLGLLPQLLLLRLGASMSSVMILGTLLVAAAMLCIERREWRMAASGAVGVLAFHLLSSKLAFVAAPGYLQQWNLSELCGLAVWGVPIEEVVWAAGFGACWPLGLAYLFGVRLAPAAECRRVRVCA